MSELRGKLLVEGRLQAGTLRTEGERIAAIELDGRASSEELPIIAPGLIDLHIHGFGGAEAESELGEMARALALAGTTGFQPTLFPDRPERLGATSQRVWEEALSIRASSAAARVLGLHLEGPFVNPLAAGALPRERLVAPSREALREILGPATGDGRGIKTMTLAPELAGSADLIDELARSGVKASLGHSRATYAEAKAVADGRRAGATHLFNAMSGAHHREVGLSGYALTGGVAYAELIGDLAHVSGEAIELALRACGPKALALISDALPGAGTGCDVFHWQGCDHIVRDGAAWFEGDHGQQLAGSATGQLEALRRLVQRGHVTVEEGLAMGTEAPARALGLEGELGLLAVGSRADLIVLAGPELALSEVWLGGERLANA